MEYTVRYAPLSESKGVSGTKIVDIVKHFYPEYSNVQSFSSFDLVASMITWSSDEKKLYRDTMETQLGAVFQKGKNFEGWYASALKRSTDFMFGDRDLIDLNTADAWYSEELKTMCVGDFVIRDSNGIHIKECKYGSMYKKLTRTGELNPKIDQYYFQCTLQRMFLEKLTGRRPDTVSLVFSKEFFDSGNVDGYELNNSRMDELEPKILDSIQKFWLAINEKQYNHISGITAVNDFVKSSTPLVKVKKAKSRPIGLLNN